MIKTNLDIEELIDNDSSKSKMKNIAKLFLQAMNDWPTQNQTLISEFISEFKNYFGSPVNPKKIIKKIDIKNESWKDEAGISIVEMIIYSKIHFNEDDFDKIVLNIINYYLDRIQPAGNST